MHTCKHMLTQEYTHVQRSQEISYQGKSLCDKQQSDNSFIKMTSLSSIVAEAYKMDIKGT